MLHFQRYPLVELIPALILRPTLPSYESPTHTMTNAVRVQTVTPMRRTGYPHVIRQLLPSLS